MTDSSAPAFAYYAQYCFHLSPTLNKWCPLRIATVQQLDSFAEFKGQNVYFYLNHPIKWVRIAGVVVAVDDFYGRPVYTVDDGSGRVLECTEKPGKKGSQNGTEKGTEKEYKGIASELPQLQSRQQQETGRPTVGTLVEIKGELRTYHETTTLQVHIVKLAVLGSTADELRFWDKVHAFATEVLQKPWVVDRAVVRECRRDARRRQQVEDKKAADKKAADRANKKWQVSSAAAPTHAKRGRSHSPGETHGADVTAVTPPRKKWSLHADQEMASAVPAVRASKGIDTASKPTSTLTSSKPAKTALSTTLSTRRASVAEMTSCPPPRSKKWNIGQRIND